MKASKRQLRKLILEQVNQNMNFDDDDAPTPTTMEDWWAGVEKDITADYKEDVSGSLSAYTGAKTIKIRYEPTGASDASGNYPADHKFEITPKDSDSESSQAEFNKMVRGKIDQNVEQAGDAFWVSMANKWGDFTFDYTPAKVEATAGRDLDMDTGDVGINEMKITRKQLRKLINETVNESFSREEILANIEKQYGNNEPGYRKAIYEPTFDEIVIKQMKSAPDNDETLIPDIGFAYDKMIELATDLALGRGNFDKAVNDSIGDRDLNKRFISRLLRQAVTQARDGILQGLPTGAQLIQKVAGIKAAEKAAAANAPKQPKKRPEYGPGGTKERWN
jgi:hypothetical protein|tara:strand:+ start:212 stop:1216 length:1005 start_codon:yes stop_codon:yes gene_type:complete